MAENNQLSDETKNNSTDTSSTDASSAVIGNHENAVVPHKISNHDKLVQTMVMVDGEWINVNDTNDQANMKEDVHKVNKKVVEAQKGIVEAKNSAESAVKYADSAVSASKVNSDAITAQDSAISEVKIALDSAAAEIQRTASNAASDAASIRADVAKVQSEVNTVKTANETEVKSIRDDLKTVNSSIATVKDHLGNVSSELDTYAKSAATQGHDITIIQQKQGQFEVDYAGTKGDVNQIKANIKGLSENLKNSEGDVASLQVTAKKLQSSMSDAEGNISNLQVTAKGYDKIFEDHLGRISKVEQTASTLTNEFSDQQGHLNRVEQTAAGTQQTVANQQGQINIIRTDASGIHETLTGQGNQIATINVTLNSLKSQYEGVFGDLNKLKNGNQWKTVTGDFDANQYTQTARIFYQDMKAKNTPDPGWFYFIVEAPVDGRVTQNLIKDNSDDSWNRFYDGEWSAWTKGVTNLDVTSLSDRVTTNSTQITQNKKEIDLKASQDTVDNLTGEVSQTKAQLKVQADQISSKVSSTEYQTLKDKVNNLRIGGRNLIPNSGTDIVIESKTTDAWPAWCNRVIYRDLTPGETYTFSVSATNTNGVKEASIRIFNEAQNKEAPDSLVFPADGKRHSTTFTLPKDGVNYSVYLYAGHMGKIEGKNFVTTFHHPQLELGNIESDYSPNPDDAIASIKKNSTAIDQTNKLISLKADQTEVDKIKNTATQNSSRLDVMADQIKSKVTSTDVNNIVDGKGYATTSTVQSLITQKAGTINESITNLTNKVNSNNGGGVNLLQGTAKINFPLNSNGGTQTIQKYDDETNYIQHTSNTPIYDMGPWWPWTPEIGQVYTMSADVCGNGYITGDAFRYEGGDTGSLSRVDLTDNWQRISNTFRVNTISGNWIIYANNSTLLKVKHIKIERGSVATPWTPAPSDNATVTQLQSVTASIDGLQSAVKNKVDQSQYTQLAGVVQTKVSQSDFNRLDNQVNVQTLDNANIDNMKTTGHYFVHNLTGNPLGGWVYVDVTGNGNDRIRQDVYQDSGTKHAFRRWFGSYWTEWSTGAEESEITQLRSDINLRVKSGDLLSQINIAAGHTLIQSNKIYFDADSFVMSPNSTAFIPSAYITDINADKINTGTLHSITINNGNGTFRVDPDGNVYANSMHVNNGSIYQGTVLGADVYSISNLTSNSLGEVNDATQNWVKLKDGIIELHGANGDHYSSIAPIDVRTTYSGDGGSTDVHHGLGILDSREVIIGSASLDSEYSNRITHSRNFDLISRTQLGITNSYIQAQLDPDVEYGKGARFVIQKDNKVGFYVGEGENGNRINVQFAGDGSGFNVYGNFNVYGAKNSAVKTSQGDVAVSAYETAEYYFGDIGEGQTDSNGVAYIGIEKLFNETVNTSIPYQVFITAYGPGNVWVEQRKQDRFMVKSSQPNIKFGWEIKAKRRGYENTRLQKVN